MRTIKNQILTSTKIDSDNERISTDKLFNIYLQIQNDSFLTQDHDLSKRPIAKLYNKQFIEIDDDEFAIVADIDIFDEEAFKNYRGFSISYISETFKLFPDKKAEIDIIFNPKYFDYKQIQEIVNLSTDHFVISGNILKQKGIESTAILILKFISASYVAGFFGKAGSNLYDKIKEKIRLISKKTESTDRGKPKLHFIFDYKSENVEYNVLIELTPDQFDVIENKEIPLSSAYSFIEKKVGNSHIRKVAIKMINTSPYWSIIFFEDSEGKIIGF